MLVVVPQLFSVARKAMILGWPPLRLPIVPPWRPKLRLLPKEAVDDLSTLSVLIVINNVSE